MANVVRVPPYQYIHVQDTNTNITRLELGPKIFIKQDHERIVTGKDPIKMVSVPPRHYVIVKDPAIRNSDGSPVVDKFGQVTVRHGDYEIRLSEDFPEPFPLYPREELDGGIKELEVVGVDEALLIEAEREFVAPEGEKREPGDQWYFEGPGTYYPRIEERIIRKVQAVKIKENQAIKLRASRALKDKFGVERKAGEDWLVRKAGAYLPGVYEQVVTTIQAVVLNDFKALHLRATKTFTDFYGKVRKAGEEWLITSRDTPSHILDIYEEFVKEVTITILDKNQYCIVLDPVDHTTGSNRYGYKEQRLGERNFFLLPGESLEGGIKQRYVLANDEALLLKAKEAVKIGDDEKQPGDCWMIYGPSSYIPPVEVEVLDTRKAIPLHINEGIYVRDIRTGKVRSEVGKAYMLQAHEELWEMNLSDVVDGLLQEYGQGRKDKTRVVNFKCPANSVVQVYDYKSKGSRVVCGPDLVMLGPDESFTLSVLSGGKPKRVGLIKTLHLMLGPDFSTDIVEVDTSDHARLSIQLSYNWHFDIDKSKQSDLEKIFNIRDFVGTICNTMAGKVRGAVASVSFDTFHRESARVIRRAIFGIDEEGRIKNRFDLPECGLVITNVDIQNVEPVDKNTKESLKQSVTLAIETATKTTEARARHEADRQAQEANDQLNRQKLDYKAKREEERIKLIGFKTEREAVSAEGEATAKAKAQAKSAQITMEASLESAELQSKAAKFSQESELSYINNKQELEIERKRQLDELEISKAKELAEIESEKFKQMISSIGTDTLVSISEAGPKMQAELLEGLGLSGYLLMDTDNPVNLFNTAQGMLGNIPGASP
jgi:major vault protein